MLGGLLHISKCLLYFPPDVKLLCLLATCCRSRSIKRRPRLHTRAVNGMIVAPLKGNTLPHDATRGSAIDLPDFTPATINSCLQNAWELLKISSHSAVFACVESDAVHVETKHWSSTIFQKKLILYSLTWTSQQSLISERVLFIRKQILPLWPMLRFEWLLSNAPYSTGNECNQLYHIL